MELPTYTNIWKIEKRLYKLYDFRLPMPLPVGQVASFLVIAVPYAIVLAMAGAPFSHTWLWVYVLPPGALAWLVTRPVLEGKRLHELLFSQLRYLSEPRTWCRMAPLTETDEVTITARIWRGPQAPSPQPVRQAVDRSDEVVGRGSVADADPAAEPQPVEPQSVTEPVMAGETDAVAARVRAAELATAAAQVPATNRDLAAKPVAAAARVRSDEPDRAGERVRAAEPSTPAGRPARWPAPDMPTPASLSPAVVSKPAVSKPAVRQPAVSKPAVSKPAVSQPAVSREPVREAPGGSRPAITVTGAAGRPNRLVERALRHSPGRRGDRVVIVPGGHRPGEPDQVQRDRARARQPVGKPARIVVLGCTAGAGQTVTTLLVGQVLATLRGEPVAVLDLNPGEASLTEQAKAMPRLLTGRHAPDRASGGDDDDQVRGRGMQVVTGGEDCEEDAGSVIDVAAARFPLAIADPAARSVPASLRVADQLVLVAPASAAAAGSLAMTLEWLEANDHGRLASAAIVVLTGVSPPSLQHVDKAAAVATGRCRAIVRVPWDERLAALAGAAPAAAPAGPQRLGADAVRAYTALAGVLVSALAGADTPAAAPGVAPRVGTTVRSPL